ncbi:Na+/H+ antiporter subunit E [Marinimicrobium agarilyticum]|uniref:Na+/H+ antiporter subunit E n=1 Tax=Marinimicrobium agarilyticum TaxID=306546 RepID=UPI0004279B66|nr:Na+/H+ antiporter subunit E [Marinimicrobium agarilyticum]
MNTTTTPRRPRRLLPHPVLSLFMLALWLLLANQISGGHLVLGALLAWFIPFVTQSFWPQEMTLGRPWVALKFVFLVLWDIVIANVIVAKWILGSPKKLKPAFMKIPLDLEQDFSITVLASTISLTPGTVSADLSPDSRYLLVHTLHTEDPAETVATIKQRYEAPLKEIFECSTS